MSPKLKFRDELKEILKTIFDPKVKWGDNQIKSYELIRHYLNTFKPKYLYSNQEADKFIIMDNLRGQFWFRSQKPEINIICSSLLEQMTVNKEESLNTKSTKVLNLIIDFKQFTLHCYYYQLVDEITSLQIYLDFEEPKKRNYFAYIVKGKTTDIPINGEERHNIPELKDLNELTKINESMLDAEHLMFFFMEIILYYDETETISNIKPSLNAEKTISEFLV